MSTAKMYQYLAQLGYSGSLADKTNAYYADMIANGGKPDLPLVGEYVPDRDNISANTATLSAAGVVAFSYFTALRSEAINNLTTYVGNAAAGATPTVCRKGIYSVAANGDLTLIASIANDTSLWAAANNAYTRALTSTFNKVVGQRYAIGIVCVTAAAIPTFIGNSPAFGVVYSVYSDAPVVCSRLTGQTDLPSNVPAGTLASFNSRPLVRLS